VVFGGKILKWKDINLTARLPTPSLWLCHPPLLCHPERSLSVRRTGKRSRGTPCRSMSSSGPSGSPLRSRHCPIFRILCETAYPELAEGWDSTNLTLLGFESPPPPSLTLQQPPRPAILLKPLLAILPAPKRIKIDRQPPSQRLHRNHIPNPLPSRMPHSTHSLQESLS
jgi:hypothetical protein